MQFLLVAEHPNRLRLTPTPHTTGGSGRYLVMNARTLSEAAKLSAEVEGKTPLLRIHVTRTRQSPSDQVMVLPPRHSAVVSLIHDASLLGIADGAVITVDDAEREPLVHAVASTLASLGYRVSSLWEPLDMVG